jgi:hypothetical protein
MAYVISVTSAILGGHFVRLIDAFACPAGVAALNVICITPHDNVYHGDSLAFAFAEALWPRDGYHQGGLAP